MNQTRTVLFDEATMTGYGLRPLTTAERAVFPWISLVHDICKGRLTRPPSGIPRVRAGWVVWIAETYPDSYLVRLPGGASILAPYHRMSWEWVSDETPATMIEDVRMDEKYRQEQANKWRPGQSITTPETRLAWCNLSEWIEAWNKLQNRAHATLRYQQEAEHIRILPLEMIAAEGCEAVLYTFLEALNQDDGIPPRGMRQKHPTTSLVVAANNRLAQLGATPYRLYRQQQSMHRALQQPPRAGPSRSARPDTSGGMTLSLF